MDKEVFIRFEKMQTSFNSSTMNCLNNLRNIIDELEKRLEVLEEEIDSITDRLDLVYEMAKASNKMHGINLEARIMNKEVTNNLWRLNGLLDALKQCDPYDFENDDADDLDKLHMELEALYAKSDETIYDLKEMIDRIRVEKRLEEEDEAYESGLRDRAYLNRCWNAERM